MIFELHIIFDEFKKTHSESNQSVVNLLFIEEPEAHTHPQMQYVFIKNIKNFLSKKKSDLNLQTVITTEANDLVGKIHDRMPVILDQSEEAKWLDATRKNDDLRMLIDAYSEKDMHMYPISMLVNSPRNDISQVIGKV
jgi:putative SOS response-associated peptidase YedK